MSYGYVYMGVVYLHLYIRRGLRVASSRFVGNARASIAELQQWSPAFLCPFMNYELGSKRAMGYADKQSNFA